MASLTGAPTNIAANLVSKSMGDAKDTEGVTHFSSASSNFQILKVEFNEMLS